MKKQKQKFSTIPIKVSRKDFNKFVEPCLSKGSRGPKTKISFYKIFNYILYVLHTGCQWYQLPIKRNEISWNAVYKKHLRWSKDGSYESIFMDSIINLLLNNKLDLSIVHGDGSNTVAKKGAKISAILDINTKKAKKSLL